MSCRQFLKETHTTKQSSQDNNIKSQNFPKLFTHELFSQDRFQLITPKSLSRLSQDSTRINVLNFQENFTWWTTKNDVKHLSSILKKNWPWRRQEWILSWGQYCLQFAFWLSIWQSQWLTQHGLYHWPISLTFLITNLIIMDFMSPIFGVDFECLPQTPFLINSM